MRVFLIPVSVFGFFFIVASLSCQDKNKPEKLAKKINDAVSFKGDVFPIIKKNCLPCHSEDNYNPSELSLDDFDKMSEGGKNGPPWVAGKSEESLVIKKLNEPPPFGDRMPLNSKRKIKEGKTKYLSAEEIQIIANWIDGGAKNN